jgi:hypothetical protein
LDYNLPFRSTGAALACLDVMYEALVLLVLILLMLLLVLVLLLLVLVLLLLVLLEPLYGGLRPRGQPYSLLDGHVGHEPEQSNLSPRVELNWTEMCFFTTRRSIRVPMYRYMWIRPFFQYFGSGMFIPDPNYFHPGSKRFRIPVSGSKNIIIFFLSFRKYDAGCSSRIRIQIFYSSRIPGSKRHRIPDPDLQHCFF